MAGMKVEEAIVEGDEDIAARRKRVIEDVEFCLAKRAKVEGEATGDGTKEEEVNNNEVDRLRELLADDPKKLSEKDVEEVIKSLKVDVIISLALNAYQVKGSNDDEEVEMWKEGEDLDVKALNAVRLMLCCIELVPTADIRLVYEKWHPKAFATVLLSAMDEYAFRRSTNPLKMEYYDIIPKLCRVLPFKLFAHVVEEKCEFPLDDGLDEVDEEKMQKEAAERCDFCFGKAEHKGTYGGVCTLMEAVPEGTAVPAGYWVECKLCGSCNEAASWFDGCSICDYEVGRGVAIPRSFLNKKGRNDCGSCRFHLCNSPYQSG